MTTVTSEIDAQRAAQLADLLRDITMESRPALADAQLDVLNKTADFLDDAARIERGERMMTSPTTGETYVVRKWIKRGDDGFIALSKEPAEDEEASGDD